MQTQEESSRRRAALTDVLRAGFQILLLKSVWMCSSNHTQHVIRRSLGVSRSFLTLEASGRRQPTLCCSKQQRLLAFQPVLSRDDDGELSDRRRLASL